MSAEQAPEKTHPVAGYVFGVILAGVLVALMGMFNGNDKASLLVPFLLGWAVVSLVIYGRLQGVHAAGEAHAADQASGH